MDDYDAPMWTDFTAPSPQVELESYFKRKQCNNETELNIQKEVVPKKLDLTDVQNEDLISNEQMAKKMPVKMVTPKKAPGSVKKYNNMRPTTYEDVLNEAMQNLQFSVSKAGNNSLHANSSCLVDSPIFKTPKRVTRSMCAQVAGTPKNTCKSKEMPTKCKVDKHHYKETKSDKSDFDETKKGDRLNVTKNELLLETVNETTKINTKTDSASVEVQIEIRKETLIEVDGNKDENVENETKKVECITADINNIQKECMQIGDINIIQKECMQIDDITSAQKECMQIVDNANNVITTETSEIAVSTEECIKITESKIEKPVNNDKKVSDEKSNNQQIQRSKVITSFSNRKLASTIGQVQNKKKPVTTLTGNAWHRQVLRRKSILATRNRLSNSNAQRLPNQQSNVQPKPESSSKFVSMAEAITKFQCGTPKRFHSTSAKSKAVTRVDQMRRVSLKLTRAVSPALMCKNRSRPVKILSTEERERLEFEAAQQHQVKANPIPVNTLKRADSLKRVEKKPITVPEPFDLTESKKSCPSLNSADSKRKPYHKKTVPTIVSTDDRGFIVQDEEVLHFGIPLEPGVAKKKNTKIVPFSFEARNRELQAKKEEKRQYLQQSAETRRKAEFHARPVPASVTRTTPIPLPGNRITSASSKSTPGFTSKVTPNVVNKPKPLLNLGPRQLSFEERNKQLLQKKEEKIKQVLKEDNKSWVFRAQRVPDFKPVLVRGRSRDNLRGKSEENLAIKSTAPALTTKKLILSSMTATKRTTPSTLIRKNSENQENQIAAAVPKIMDPKKRTATKSVSVLSELNTDKRAKERQDFDEKIKQFEEQNEQLRLKEEKQRIAAEKAQIAELRKMTETKARPMPVYKPLTIMKSTKPLTEAQSPAWTKKKGPTH